MHMIQSSMIHSTDPNRAIAGNCRIACRIALSRQDLWIFHLQMLRKLRCQAAWHGLFSNWQVQMVWYKNKQSKQLSIVVLFMIFHDIYKIFIYLDWYGVGWIRSNVQAGCAEWNDPCSREESFVPWMLWFLRFVWSQDERLDMSDMHGYSRYGRFAWRSSANICRFWGTMLWTVGMRFNSAMPSATHARRGRWDRCRCT